MGDALATVARDIERCRACPRLVAWLAKPVRCSEAYRKSPERSPVNMRPVRLAPCAAGARPSTMMRAAGSPNPVIGRPQ
jgi:hypothetical protein